MAWEPQFFGSGTCIVKDTAADPRSPHLYVYGPFQDDYDAKQRQRVRMCYEIAEYMNGGERPAWIDDLERTHECYGEDLDGTSVRATGPSIDTDPPNLNWREDTSDEAKDARARLMDRFFGVEAKHDS